MMVPPSWSIPRATASSMMERAARSLIDPLGFTLSLLTYTWDPGGAMRPRRIIGVSPIVSVMLL